MAHEEYIRVLPDSPHAVVLIHGILGTPDHFRDLLPLIPANWSVYNILLPGHGGSVRDFSRSSMAQWRGHVAALMDTLATRHGKILLVGHSMGTLFAIQESVKRPETVAGLFLLQTPLRPRIRLSAACRAFLLPFGIVTKKAAQMYRATSVEMDIRLWRYLGWIPRFLELLTECRRTRQLLGQITVPCRIFQSRRDEMVSMRTCRDLAKYPHLQVTVLEHAGHYGYPGSDLALMQRAFGEMIHTLE